MRAAVQSPERVGPVAVPGDTWDNLPSPEAAADIILGTDAGRRPRVVPWRYLVVAVILAATALGVGGVLPLLGTTGTGPDALPVAWSGGNGRVAPKTPSPSSTVIAVLDTAPPALPPLVQGADAARVPVIAPLGYEAEAVHPAGRRHVRTVAIAGASGGAGITFTKTSGVIEFRSLAVPDAGAYRVTVVYAPGASSRSGRVTGSGEPVAVTFASGTGCCAAVSVTVSLSVGGTIRIQPTGWGDALPAIDRIVVARA